MAETVAVVTLFWGSDVVAVRTVRPGGSTAVASRADAGGLAALPPGLLQGVEECAVRVWNDGLALVVVPTGVVAQVAEHDAAERTVVGPRTLQLARGANVALSLGSSADLGVGCEAPLTLVVEVIACEPGAFAEVPRWSGGVGAHVLAAALVHAVLLVASGVFGTPPDEAQHVLAMQQALARSEERALEESATEVAPQQATPSTRQPGSSRVAGGTAPGPPAVGEAVRGPDSFDAMAVPIPNAPGAQPALPRTVRGRPAQRATQDAQPATVAQLGVVQRVMHQSAPRFRACSEAARARGGDGRGEVVPEFVIDGGKVAGVRDGGSTVEDPELLDCVLDAFSRLTFPVLPEEGARTGRYRLAFSAGRP